MNLGALNPRALIAVLSRLSKRDRKIAYAVVFLISLAVLDRLIINPVSSKMRSLNEEIVKKEESIHKSLSILSQKDRITAETRKYSSFVTKGSSEEEEITTFLKDIEELASKSSVYLVDLKPAGVKDVGSAKKYVVALNCEAQMEQIVSFMFSIENSAKLLTIDKYQINPKSKESTVAQCGMSVSKIVMP
ncbi:MAG: GspMb/PilO family protein [Candidatus Omnitrophota bacterium]